jgi:hypothetical protein
MVSNYQSSPEHRGKEIVMSEESVSEGKASAEDSDQKEDDRSSEEQRQVTISLPAKTSLGRQMYGSALTTQWHYTLLFVILLAFVAFIPLNTLIEFDGLDIVLAIVLITVVYTSSRKHKWIMFGLVLAVPPLILASMRELNETTPPYVFAIYFISIGALLLLSMIAILQEVLKARRVTIHTISGSMSIYLLAALLWGVGYTVVELLWPNSFTAPLSGIGGASASVSQIFADLFFFSLVTITTAGYGDVTPLSPQARSLTSLELVIGQIFLAILVAWLVGMFIAHSMLENERSS